MSKGTKRNVLIFLTDGHRADALGCYGNPILRTPNFDALAAGGTRFTACFATDTVCMPTRASLFTGRYPHIHGVWANGVPLPKGETTLAQVREPPELLARGLDPAGFKAKALRTKDWKLVHYPGKSYGELYDLRNDPDEFENLWAEPQRRGARAEMERLLLDRLAESEEPLPERRYVW